VKLVLTCVECPAQVEASFDDERMRARRLYREHGWFLSAQARDGGVMAPVCPTCALRVYPPELLEAAKRQLAGKGAN